ncbi:MAG: hypothetical protein CO137_02145 [Candidatus Magasanikbacteria bacterium CG_4_9_14_3_um_filter_32_9]|uniref:Thymidylate kinase n=1 Tax=Candidatus Magasanikbacteria bacterium CG_4_9_14_3_um_filter_32_9 TaxID=1974644 RepID=A0A2M7Z6S3_9BACT|nr:MAG: hypothetical protein CO137_02145 [Candidatus Magasanikbacteria bacterium CG_4_9_14_3_um_filter_32_9]
MFIIVDGIDGSGKTTIIKTWAEYLEKQGKKVFNLVDYWKENEKHPKAEDLMEYDVIISGEPTHAWIGKAIRDEIIQNGNDYSAKATAEAYSLDRLVLYKRILLPLLKAGKIILQDRSVSTSLCYQPIQGNISMDFVANLEGNAFTLKNAPDYLIIADLPVDSALTRLSKRYEKKDNTIFENKPFLEKARTQFLNPEYQKYFTQKNTQIKVLNVNTEIDIMKTNALDLLKQIIK